MLFNNNNSTQRSVLEFLPFPIFALNKKGEIIQFNEIMKKIIPLDSQQKLPFFSKEEEKKWTEHFNKLNSSSYKEDNFKINFKKNDKKELYEILLIKEKTGPFETIINCFAKRLDKENTLTIETENIEYNNLKTAIEKTMIVSITDTEGILTYVNERFCELSQYPQEELLGNTYEIISSEQQPKETFTSMWETIHKGEIWKGELKNKAKDGSYYWTSATIIPFLDKEGQPYQYLGIHSEITQQKKVEEKFEEISKIHTITKLPNVKKFEEEVIRLVKIVRMEKKNLSLIYIRLNNLNLYSEVLGHNISETLLKEICSKLTDFKKGTLYHIETDTFALLLKDYNEKESEDLAKEILKTLNDPITIERNKLHFTCNIGISSLQEKGENNLLKNANTALSNSLNRGRKKIVVYNKSLETISYNKHKNFLLSNDIHSALEQEKIEVLYQPKMKVNTGKIVGVYCSLYWKHKELGEIKEKDLLQVLDKEDLNEKILEFLLEKISEQHSHWNESNYEIPVTYINLSVQQLKNQNFYEQLERHIKDYNLEPGDLGFQIKNFRNEPTQDIIISNIKNIKNLGSKIMFEDFNFALADTNFIEMFDNIKIRETFIKGLTDKIYEEEQKKLLKHFSELAHSFNKEIVIEGVERSREVTILRDVKCDIVQGVLFSAPVNDKKISQLIKKGYLKDEGSKLPDFENKREYFRIDLSTTPLEAQMTIIQINGKPVDMKKTKALIEDIGGGGFKFLSPLKIPITDNITLSFEIYLLGKNLTLRGSTRWQKPHREGIQEYGLKFFNKEEQQNNLIDLLNKVQIILRNEHGLPDSLIVTENKYQYLLGTNKEK